MKIGYVMSPGRGDVDRVLGRFVEALMARGVDVAGSATLVRTRRSESTPDVRRLVADAAEDPRRSDKRRHGSQVVLRN